jgi:hypothetical protein
MGLEIEKNHGDYSMRPYAYVEKILKNESYVRCENASKARSEAPEYKQVKQLAMPVRNAGFGGIGASAEGGAHGPLNIMSRKICQCRQVSVNPASK